MALIEGFHIRNYRALKDVTVGKLWTQQDTLPLTPLVAVIGKNGVGRDLSGRPFVAEERLRQRRKRQLNMHGYNLGNLEPRSAALLGDRSAMLKVFPKAKRDVLDAYVRDSACRTWEVLDDAVSVGGSAKLKSEGFKWAWLIGQQPDVDRNASPSFEAFRRGLIEVSGPEE